MIISINGGHTKASPGAIGILDEWECDRAVKSFLVPYLQSAGITAHDSTSPETYASGADLQHQARTTNASGAEIAASIHLNAGGGTGPEVWYWAGSEEGRILAEKLSAALASLYGLPDRGAKATRQFYWLANTEMTAVLLELCFVDTRADAEAHWRVGSEAVARVIAEVLSGQAIDQPSVPNTPEATSYGEYVTTVALNVRTGPGTRYRKKSRAELTPNGRVHADSNGVLGAGTSITVYETESDDSNLWGRIPSGWVCLRFGGEEYARTEATDAPHGAVGTYALLAPMNVRSGPGTGYARKSRTALTPNGRLHADASGVLQTGTVVDVLETTTESGNLWGRIPSGWIALKHDNNIYAQTI